MFKTNQQAPPPSPKKGKSPELQDKELEWQGQSSGIQGRRSDP